MRGTVILGAATVPGGGCGLGNVHPDHIFSLLNSMSVKDEAGVIPVGPLFAQALEDALHDVNFAIAINSYYHIPLFLTGFDRSMRLGDLLQRDSADR